MIEMVFSAIFNMLSIYIGFRMIQVLLERKSVNPWLARGIYFAVWLGNWGLYCIFHNGVITTLSLGVGLLFAVMILYEGSVAKKLMTVLANLAVGMISENLVWSLYAACMGHFINEALGSILSVLLNMLIVIVVQIIWKPKRDDMIPATSYISVIAVTIGSAVLGEILVRMEVGHERLAMIGLIILCILDVSIYYIYDKINDIYQHQMEHEFMRQQMYIYQNQLDIMNSSMENVRILRHDMKNHVLALQMDMDAGKYEQVREYIRNMQDQVAACEQYIDTGCRELDTILNYKIAEAKRQGCTVRTQLEIPENTLINEMDLNILLGNLLDNAMEALAYVENKCLLIKVQYRQGVYMICIRNTYDGYLEQKGDRLISRKVDRAEHGIGLKSIDRIVQKYHGIREMSADGVEFEQKIMLIPT